MAKTKTSKKQLFLFNGLLFIIALIFIQYSIATHEPDEQTVLKNPITPLLQGRIENAMVLFDVPRDMPDIQFRTIFGNEMSLNNMRGQWVILNFWATWCAPCLVEMPSLQAAQDEFGGQGIKVVAVSLDRNMNGDKLRLFMEDKGFGPIAAYYDAENTVMRTLNLRGLPSTYIIAPNGKAIGVVEGDVDWVGNDARVLINSLVNPI
jgi:thiol-disulfide isomerase/thioredoxin